MVTKTLRNVPDQLYEALKEQAVENRRSLNQEVKSRLAAATSIRAPDVAAEIRRVRRLHGLYMGPPLTPAQVDDMINAGHA